MPYEVKTRVKTTTVRFWESDLDYLQKLQEKLGLGRMQVIRLAIRKLAELEDIDTD